jgi:hypothetical protein
MCRPKVVPCQTSYLHPWQMLNRVTTRLPRGPAGKRHGGPAAFIAATKTPKEDQAFQGALYVSNKPTADMAHSSGRGCCVTGTPVVSLAYALGRTIMDDHIVQLTVARGRSPC